ncbi:MAG: wcaJ [Gammaproteobacteria bacterium]|nr:wcaJ [Gammaproteobacteria bacterium]
MLPKGLLKEYSQILTLLARGLDVFAIIAAGLLAYFCKFGDIHLSSEYMAALAMAAVLTLVVFSGYHIYESARTLSFWQYLRKLLQAVFVVLILLAGLAFLTKTGEDFSRSWFIIWTGLLILFLLLFRGAILLILRLMRAKGFNERRIIIIGAGQVGTQLAETVQHALWTGLRIVAIFDEKVVGQRSIAGVPVIAMPDNIPRYLSYAKETIDEIWLALPVHAEARVKAILHDLRYETITTRLVLDVFGMDLDLLNHSISQLAGFPVINICSTPMIGINRIIKAVEDRVLAMVILLLISPFFLIIALLIKLSSPGPIFYKQKRVSWNGKEFAMLKFRTMPVDIEATTGPVWAKEGENRATWIGKFLRKTSLDELPQFINVLRGDMSIVGPRPERMVFVNQFKDQIPHYMQKHLVKAGITGWAQVNGWRGNTSLEKRIEYDLYYIENWSLQLDLKIIFLTFFRGFMNKNAY